MPVRVPPLPRIPLKDMGTVVPCVALCQVLLHPTHITVRKLADSGLRTTRARLLGTGQWQLSRIYSLGLGQKCRWKIVELGSTPTGQRSGPTPSCIAQPWKRAAPTRVRGCRESIDPKLQSSGFNWQELTSLPLSGGYQGIRARGAGWGCRLGNIVKVIST